MRLASLKKAIAATDCKDVRKIPFVAKVAVQSQTIQIAHRVKSFFICLWHTYRLSSKEIKDIPKRIPSKKKIKWSTRQIGNCYKKIESSFIWSEMCIKIINSVKYCCFGLQNSMSLIKNLSNSNLYMVQIFLILYKEGSLLVWKWTLINTVTLKIYKQLYKEEDY